MKLLHPAQGRRGISLVVALVFCSVTLLILAGALHWTATNTNLSVRSNQFNRSVAMAEAATEKVIAHIVEDYRKGGEVLVVQNLHSYRNITPMANEHAETGNYRFSDGQGRPNRTYVEHVPTTEYRILTAQYRGLRGYSTRLRVISNASEKNSVNEVAGAVRQDFELASIPLFQFAIFYNLDLEVQPGPVMDVTGPVHCNENIYLAPGATLTFHEDVTASRNIIQGRKPGDTRGAHSGLVVFKGQSVGGVSSLNLPIGTNNSPVAVRQVVEVPPSSENPNSDIGRERFYNKADMVVSVWDNKITVTSGRYNNFATTVPPSQWDANSNLVSGFIKRASFFNKRENKTVNAVDVDIGKMTQWNLTDTSLRPLLAGSASKGNVSLVFVADYRTETSTHQPGVRLVNGKTLPEAGLTVATRSPLYIFGDYNVASSSGTGSGGTTGTKPAAVVGDSITVLSGAWKDANSSLALSSRIAADTTVNAAFLAGIVQTTSGSYSGGVENFPRFLERWTNKKFTYNGSMVVMFPSQFADAAWGGTGDTYGIYDAPIRQWAFDTNFREMSKLPPGTPMVRAVIRNSWDVMPPNTTTVSAK